MIKNLLLLLMPLCFCIVQSTQGQAWELIWSDEFNGTHLDQNNWNFETGTGVNGDFGTGQLDRATDRPENVGIEHGIPGADGGALRITTLKEPFVDRQYTSGRINTAGKVSWGPNHRIVARIWPKGVRTKGQGFAFWMMPDELPEGKSTLSWPQGGEIDIMEYVGSIPAHNLGSVHYAWEWNNNNWADWNHGYQGSYYSFEQEQSPDNPEWIQVDLGEIYLINSVVLDWENPAKSFEIQTSTDGTTWSKVTGEKESNGKTDKISFAPTNAHFVRMYGTQRANKWGYSLFEFQVFAENGNINLASNRPATASSSQSNDLGPEKAVDDNKSSRWASTWRDPEYICCQPSSDTDPNVAANGWHEYGIDWYPNRIAFFVDGNIYHIHYFEDGDAFEVDGKNQEEVQIVDGKRVSKSAYSNIYPEWHPFERKMYAILSAGVGGNDNSTYGGAIVDEAVFPADVYIDWVRVYSNGETYNPPPTVFLTLPEDNSEFTAPADIELTATATDREGGTISEVAFYNGNEVLGTVHSSPYNYHWTNVPEGTYTLNAKATDDGGAIATSNAVTITVKKQADVISAVNDDADDNLLIYPVPVKDIVVIQHLAGKYKELEITDLTGNIILEKDVNGLDDVEINLSHLNPGLYVLKLKGYKNHRIHRIIKK